MELGKGCTFYLRQEIEDEEHVTLGLHLFETHMCSLLDLNRDLKLNVSSMCDYTPVVADRLSYNTFSGSTRHLSGLLMMVKYHCHLSPSILKDIM